MDLEKELYMKSPAVLRDKLLNSELEFPSNTLFEYEKILTYRLVEREKDDNHSITNEDFKSYFELNKSPKVARGIKKDFKSDPCYYGVSSFTDYAIAKQKTYFPRPGKKMAKGFVYSEGGPQYTKEKHVCWWLYANTKIKGFELMEDE